MRLWTDPGSEVNMKQFVVHSLSCNTLTDVAVHRAGSKVRLSQGALYWNGLLPSQSRIYFLVKTMVFMAGILSISQSWPHFLLIRIKVVPAGFENLALQWHFNLTASINCWTAQKLNMTQHCELTAQKANCILGCNQTQHGQLVEGGDSAPLFHSG